MSSKPKVVIIGAGIAGLSAASKLHKSGKFDVCVLEASERVGGRIHTGKIGENTVEFGAGWIHGTIDNPIFDLACDLKLLHKSDFDKKWMNENSREKPQITTSPLKQCVDDQLLTEVWNVFDKLYLETEDIQKMSNFTKGITDSKMSVGEYMRQGFESYLDSCTSDTPANKKLKCNLFSYFEERECNNAACNSLDDLNLEDFGDYINLDGSGSCPVPGGYDKITKALAAELKSDCVCFGHEVTQINWVASIKSDLLPNSHPVKILCRNSKTFNADHVIVTVSLGILKEKHSTLFCPALPTEKLTAIQNLGFGYVGRIFLEFEAPFWHSDEYNLPLIWENKENCKIESEMAGCPWVHRLYSFFTTRPGSNVLQAWFQGDEALHIERTPPQIIGEQCLAAINKCTTLKSLPSIVNVDRTQWAINPWTRGSYSFLSKAASASDFDILATPLPYESAGSKKVPAFQLLFAGEATHRQCYGTVHGAYFTGVREAERLLKHYCSNST